MLLICKSHTITFSSNGLITNQVLSLQTQCRFFYRENFHGLICWANCKRLFFLSWVIFFESSNLEEAVLVITKRKSAMGYCSPPNYIFKAPFLESVPLLDFLWPPSVAHCVLVSRLIQNTFVLACIINLHSFTLWQQGIQSTCALCQPPPSPFVWDCDTKKLSPCVFITITSKETTNLIEYVIAPGI